MQIGERQVVDMMRKDMIERYIGIPTAYLESMENLMNRVKLNLDRIDDGESIKQCANNILDTYRIPSIFADICRYVVSNHAVLVTRLNDLSNILMVLKNTGEKRSLQVMSLTKFFQQLKYLFNVWMAKKFGNKHIILARSKILGRKTKGDKVCLLNL